MLQGQWESKVRHWRHNETQVLTRHLIGNSPIHENREKYNHTQEREREIDQERERERERQSEW
jgi:hypothetical protein